MFYDKEAIEYPLEAVVSEMASLDLARKDPDDDDDVPPLVDEREDQAVVTCTAASLPGLPCAVTIHIMSYLYDDLPAIQNMLGLCKSMSRMDTQELKAALGQVSCEDPKNFCGFCKERFTYPYKLADCQHIACGHCLWFHAPNGCCGICDTKIRNKPTRLADRTTVSARAFWLPPEQDDVGTARLEEHEQRIHGGTAGFFGKDGQRNTLEQFDGVGFPGDFDDMKTVSMRDLKVDPNRLPKGKVWEIVICPAAQNYSGFPHIADRRSVVIAAFDDVELWEELDTDDIVLLCVWRSRSRFRHGLGGPDKEYRLVGWEEFLQSEDELDE